MTEKDVDNAIEKVIASPDLYEKLKLDKRKVYDIRKRRGLEYKLKVLFDAGLLKLK